MGREHGPELEVERDLRVVPVAIVGLYPALTRTDDMVAMCRKLPGNRERLAHYFDLCRPKLVITLGNEVAAFARGLSVAKDAQECLYALEPTKSVEFGPRPLDVVHCAHPGILMRPGATEWNRKHHAWCRGVGAKLVAEALRA